MKNKRKLVIDSLTIGLMLCMIAGSVASCSEGTETTEPTTTVVTEVSETAPTEPTDYVHGEEGYYTLMDNGIVTEVQDQGYTPDCWAYATRDVLRLGYQMAYGKDLDGEEFKVRKIKELTFANKEEGIRLTEGESVNSVIGGSDQYVVWVMANGYEGYTVIENPSLCNVDKSENENDPLYSNAVTPDQIKELLKTKGALPVILRFGSGIIKYKGMTLMNDDQSYDENDSDAIRDSYLGHEALIVGYDDNFPKEYFGQYGHRTPSIDGAWLYKETQGETWGDGGYAWMSYESCFVVNGYITLSDAYSKVLSYDCSTAGGVTTGDKTTAANVYHEGGKLAAVGTYVGVTETLHDGMYGMQDEEHSITIEIRDADLNEILATKTATFDYDGYYVVELDEPIEVTDFSVVVTYNGYAPVEGRTEGKIRSAVEYIAKSEPGQSFILVDGEWVDVTDVSLVERLNLKEEPNNVCIKALFVD
ncbi:MAG: hypothetical protein J6U54_24505 [Clostridiales bacterium]|nr:hypothetical protein [Clostridiales bacterium]